MASRVQMTVAPQPTDRDSDVRLLDEGLVWINGN